MSKKNGNQNQKLRPSRAQLIDHSAFVAMLNEAKGETSLKEFGPKMGVSFQFMGKVLAGDLAPGPTIAKHLGYEQTVAFRRLPRKKSKKAKAKK